MSEQLGTETGACLNCGAALAGPFCASCGQKRPHTNVTLREFISEATEELAHWEGKIPNTLRTLVLKPGQLTLDFFAGRRARWLPPLRVYLICSLAYFLSGPLTEAVTHRAAREVAKFTVTNSDGTTDITPEVRAEIVAGLPAKVFGTERVLRATSNSAQLNRTISEAYPKVMFVLLPLFALLTSVAWRRKLPRYPAHLYLALHLHAAFFVALAVTTIASAFIMLNAIGVVVGLAGFVYIIWYGLATVRRVFDDSWGLTIAKVAAISVVYACCFIVVGLGMLAYALTRI